MCNRPKNKKDAKSLRYSNFLRPEGTISFLDDQRAYKSFMCLGRLPPKRDRTTQAPRTILRKAMLCITTCAMRHSADHRCKHLPLLVRQRAHIDHSNIHHIYHNILCYVNAWFFILIFSCGRSNELNLILLNNPVRLPSLTATQGSFFISLIPLRWQWDCPVGRYSNSWPLPKARSPL